MKLQDPSSPASIQNLLASIRACRACIEAPAGPPLPHEPRPVLQASSTARLAIFGQAPGLRVHESGRPFADASGDRLRAWLGIGEDIFYDAACVAIVPMGFCFPGYDAKGADMAPRKECAPLWRPRVMAGLTSVKTAVLVGAYAQRWHLGDQASDNLTDTVTRWRDFAPACFPTPHPSWRNSGWLKKHPWFETDLLRALRAAVVAALANTPGAP